MTTSTEKLIRSATSAARAFADSVPAAKREFARGALRAGDRLSGGAYDARDKLSDAGSQLSDALDAAMSAARSAFGTYRGQAQQQLGSGVNRAADYAHDFIDRGRSGLYSEFGAETFASSLMRSARRHPYVAVGIVAGALYLVARSWRRRSGIDEETTSGRSGTRRRGRGLRGDGTSTRESTGAGASY